MCCILENYQTPTGVRVPRVLQPFMCGMEFLPFRKSASGVVGGATAGEGKKKKK